MILQHNGLLYPQAFDEQEIAESDFMHNAGLQESHWMIFWFDTEKRSFPEQIFANMFQHFPFWKPMHWHPQVGLKPVAIKREDCRFKCWENMQIVIGGRGAYQSGFYTCSLYK